MEREKAKYSIFFIFLAIHVILLTNCEHRKKEESKSNKDIFLGYSANSGAYRVFNKQTRNVMESINVDIFDTNELSMNYTIEEDEEQDGSTSVSQYVPVKATNISCEKGPSNRDVPNT